MTVDIATIRDKAAIERLWSEVFQDDPEQIRSFLEHFLESDTAFVIREAEDILSMLFLIRASLVYDGKSEPIGYIYAGMTRASARGKGLYRRILQAAEAYAVEHGMKAVFLQPADDALALSYERMGFDVPLYADFLKGSAVEAPSSEFLPADVYGDKRRQRLTERHQPFVEWPLRVYHHTSLWGRGFEMPNGTLLLLSPDETVPADTLFHETVLERVGAETQKQIPIGRLKWLTAERIANDIYMGYGMD